MTTTIIQNDRLRNLTPMIKVTIYFPHKSESEATATRLGGTSKYHPFGTGGYKVEAEVREIVYKAPDSYSYESDDGGGTDQEGSIKLYNQWGRRFPPPDLCPTRGETTPLHGQE